MGHGAWRETRKEVGADAEFPRGQVEVQGRIFVLCVLWGRDDLYRCLDQGF